eukprot:2404297-Pleurochrysis_carterae.AAC.1
MKNTRRDGTHVGEAEVELETEVLRSLDANEDSDVLRMRVFEKRARLLERFCPDGGRSIEVCETRVDSRMAALTRRASSLASAAASRRRSYTPPRRGTRKKVRRGSREE